MRNEVRGLASLRPYENNPRDNDAAVDAVAESIRSYGFLQPIVCDSYGVIVAGHTRYKAALRLGLAEVPCVVLEEGELTSDEVRAYRIADNKTSDASVWDNRRLLVELEGLDDLFTGFEQGGAFDAPGLCTDVQPEDLDGVLEANEAGIAYVLRVTSADREAVEELAEAWKAIRGRSDA